MQAVKQRLDVAQLVRDHPWPALGAAVVLGAFVGGSGADEKAAVATVAGAKAAASASKNAVSGAMEKLHSRTMRRRRRSPSRARSPGSANDSSTRSALSVAGGLDRLVDDMRIASRDSGARAGGLVAIAGASDGRDAPAVVAIAEPVAAAPNDADHRRRSGAGAVRDDAARGRRARDAVEALGGGTHEPPLAPGAGDLGARWA